MVKVVLVEGASWILTRYGHRSAFTGSGSQSGPGAATPLGRGSGSLPRNPVVLPAEGKGESEERLLLPCRQGGPRCGSSCKNSQQGLVF